MMQYHHGFAMPSCSHSLVKAEKWLNGTREAYEIAMQYVKGRSLAIDLGAHCGLMTARMCADFDRVIAFEPLDSNIDCIRVNAPKAEIAPVAAGARREAQRFVSNKSHMLHHNAEGSLLYRVDPVDDYADACDLLKIDIEGMELEALQGAQTVLKSLPVLIIELKLNATPIRDALSRLGYSEKWANHVDGVFVA